VLVKLFYTCMCFLCNSRVKSSLELMLCVIDISTLNKTYLIWTSCSEEVVTSIHTPERLPHCEYCTGFRTAKQNQTNKKQLYIHVQTNKPHLTLIRCDNSYFLFGNDWLSVATDTCIDRRSLQIHVFHECALSQYFVMKTIIPTVLQIQFWKYAK
jgi:hypothetical protein